MFTNGGVLPAQDVHITCIQKLVEYDSAKLGLAELGPMESSNVPSASIYAPSVRQSEQTSLICSQVLRGFRF
jgi:hypothetical protein